MSVLHAVYDGAKLNGMTLGEFFANPFIDVDVSESPHGPKVPPARFFGFRATLIPILAAVHVWALVFGVIPSFVS